MKKIAAVLALSLVVHAADGAGTWRLAYTTGNGLPREATLHLTLEGDNLAGTLSSGRGVVRIEAGKLRGNEIRFDVVRKGNGDEIAIHFKGKVDGETMKLDMQFGKRDPIEITGRKIP